MKQFCVFIQVEGKIILSSMIYAVTSEEAKQKFYGKLKEENILLFCKNDVLVEEV